MAQTMSRKLPAETETETENVSETVVSAVAELTETDPLSLEPLYTAIDTDALNSFFECDQTAGFDRLPERIEFTYCDCDVVITANGDVQVSKGDREITKRWI